MEYNEQSIKIFKGIDAVRVRPSVYIGSTDVNGVHHLFKEIFTNSLDENLAGYGEVIIIQKKGDQISIRDFGRGIPYGIHPDEGISTLTIVACDLHAGGKFDENAYKVSGGLYGLGLSIVNALASDLVVQSTRNGSTATQYFQQGKPVSDVLLEDSNQPTGTLVVFKPDPTIFDDTSVPLEWFVRDAYYAACLNSVKIILSLDGQDLTLENLSPASMLEKTTSHEPIQIPWISSGNIHIRFAFGIAAQPNAFLFVNGVSVTKGNFLNTFLECFASKLRDSGLDFQADDLPHALSMVIAIKAPTNSIEFRGQTKDAANIKNIDLRLFFNTILEYVWKARGFRSLLTSHYKPILSVIKKRRSYEKEIKEAVKELDASDTGSSFLLPGQLADCRLKWKGELFLVEGQSAAGSAKQARDSAFQAVLPLRGKLLNTVKASIKDTLSNGVIQSIFRAIGVDVSNKEIKITPRYEKFIITPDADIDGHHIATLLYVCFLQWMRPLIEQGYLYRARAPLFKISDRRGKTKYAYTDQELQALAVPQSSTVSRFKGLGEMNPDQLREAVFDPATRRIEQVTIRDLHEASTIAYTLLGPESDTRLDFLTFFASDLDDVRWQNIDI